MGRKEINFNDNWKFLLGDKSNSKDIAYDNIWEDVNLPHAVKLSPANASGGRNYQGICWYKKCFFISKKYQVEKVYIKFNGAMSVAEVHINGKDLPVHYGGYLPFIFDVTDFVTYGEEKNNILVRLNNLDNDDVPPGKPQEDLDFTYEGGIYRNVEIIIVNKLHITDAIYANKVAGGGIFVTYPVVNKDYAKISIKTHVINENLCEKKFNIIHTLIDKNENVRAEVCINGILKNEEDGHFISEMEVEKPLLWHPNTPHLYKLYTKVIEDHNVIDEIKTIIGIRSIKFTKEGFFINGEALKISGANYHQTGVYIGNAMPDSMLRRDARKLRQAGFFHIRSHYPLASAFLDECNKVGHTLTVSTPGWQWFKEGLLVERTYENIRNMVRWQRNNPCVILWEPVLNESYMPDWFQKRVHEIVHEEFPYDTCYTASDNGPTDVVYREFDIGMLGLLGKNHNPEELKKISETRDKPLWIREYGDSPDNWSDQNCAWRVPRNWGEHAMLKQVERTINPKETFFSNYTNLYNKPNICGFGIWPGMEHNRGYHVNPCWGGVFDLYKIPKYSYYFFKSQMEPELKIENIECGPMVFIANYWTELSPDDVVVYSNCDEVRLYHNGVLVGTQKPDSIPLKHPPFTFKNVKKYKGRERSEIRVEGLIDGKIVAEDKRFSPGVPKSLMLSADFMGINLKADGSDIVMVYCDMIDDKGNTVPMSGDGFKVKFAVFGEGKIIGDKDIGANPINFVMGKAGIMIQSTKKAGSIIITANVENPQKYSKIAIKPAKLEIFSQH